MLDKATFIRECVISEMSDDYENFEKIMERTKQEGALKGIDIEQSEVEEAIKTVIAEGYAEAYVLSPHPPHSQRVEYSPDKLFDLWYYVTPRGKAAARRIQELAKGNG